MQLEPRPWRLTSASTSHHGESGVDVYSIIRSLALQ